MLALKRPEPRAGVLEIEQYVPGGKATPRGVTVFKLSSNETPLGPSPGAVCAYHEAAEHLAVYPDGSGAALRAVIGRAYALNPALIVCGAGSDELLNLLAHAFVGPGDEAIHTTHGFLVYPIATLGAGARPIVAPPMFFHAPVYRHLVDKILARHGNDIADGDMFDLDMSYVVNRSFGLDLLLICKTVPTVLFRRSLY